MTALLAALLSAAPSGTATVPLEELVELLDPKQPAEARAVAAITSLGLTGHPGEAGLWLDVEVGVRVVSGTTASVSVLQVGPDTVVESLPDVADAVVQLEDGAVRVVCTGAQSHRLTFKLLVRAAKDGRRSLAQFSTASGVPPAPLKLDVDDGLFDVPSAAIVREWGGYVVLPQRQVYSVSWAAKSEETSKRPVSQRAPVDPLVKTATSTWTSTLEGRATHELQLTLQLDRPATFAVDLPAAQQLLRAKVNGLPITVEPGARRVVLEVAPASLGATDATIELSTAQDFGVFHLSGALTLEGPTLAWPVSQWTTRTVLPKVFTYERRGGSMEQVGNVTETTEGVPGKALFFTQHLISASAPVIALGYSVDLGERYFR